MQKNRKKVLTFCNTDSILIKSVAVATDEYGILAQLGEHLPYKQRVIGSSPIGPIYADVAQLAEQLICNQQVNGSSPFIGLLWLLKVIIKYGWIPEWPKGTDCKSAANCFGGSNPPPSIRRKP